MAQLLLSYRGDTVSEKLLKDSFQFLTAQSTRASLSARPTHSQLGEPWGFLGRLLVGSVRQGGDDALAMAEQVHLQDLGWGGEQSGDNWAPSPSTGQPGTLMAQD